MEMVSSEESDESVYQTRLIPPQPLSSTSSAQPPTESPVARASSASTLVNAPLSSTPPSQPDASSVPTNPATATLPVDNTQDIFIYNDVPLPKRARVHSPDDLPAFEGVSRKCPDVANHLAKQPQQPVATYSVKNVYTNGPPKKPNTKKLFSVLTASNLPLSLSPHIQSQSHPVFLDFFWFLGFPRATITKKTLRPIFTQNLVALDTQSLDTLTTDLHSTKQSLSETEIKLSTANMLYTSTREENVMLRKEIQSLKTEIERLKWRQGDNSFGGSSSSGNGSASVKKFWLQASLEVSADGDSMRVFTFTKNCDGVYIAKGESPTRHGLQYINLSDPLHTLFHPLHTSMIRDIHISPHDPDKILSTSLDKSLKLFSIKSSAVVQTYELDAPGWSVCFDAVDEWVGYCGGMNHVVWVVDFRWTGGVLKRIDLSGVCGWVGVHSLCSVVIPDGDGGGDGKDGGKGKSGLFGGTTKTAFWIEDPGGDEYRVSAVYNSGKQINSVSWDKDSKRWLACSRPQINMIPSDPPPPSQSQQPTTSASQQQQVRTTTKYKFRQTCLLATQSTHNYLPKSCIFSVPANKDSTTTDNETKRFVVSGGTIGNVTFSPHLFKVYELQKPHTGTHFESLREEFVYTYPNEHEKVWDVKFGVGEGGRVVLGTLTDKRVTVHEWK
ncbi:RING finger and WD repeat domain-containing protein 3 [Nowakowskiella sp. JEL0407]|nr:RING finger and WD repeat domain-containing protein 3 [Nowakowskiella sp. JEL0407]